MYRLGFTVVHREALSITLLQDRLSDFVLDNVRVIADQTIGIGYSLKLLLFITSLQIGSEVACSVD